MLVDDPVAFVHAKFANMCAYLAATYGDAFDTTAMLAIPPMALFVMLRRYLLPHAAHVEASNADALVDSLEPGHVAGLAVACKDDAKLMRYLQLFCTMVA